MKIIRIGILGFGLAVLGLLVLDRVGRDSVPAGIDSGGPDELPVFVTYLRRGQDSTTQSNPAAASS